jgi:hypothetical protein
VKFNVLAEAAKVTNFPILVNQGVSTQHFILKGERLQDLARLEAQGAKLELGDVSGNGAERSITVQFASNMKPGTSLPVTEYLQDRAAPETIAGGLQITGPLPVITSSRLSLPAGLTIAMQPNEFPAGSTLTAVLDVKNIERKSLLHLTCADDPSPRSSLQIGEQNPASSLQQLSPDQLFLSYTTAALPAGCELEAVIDNGRNGKSQPFQLAKIVLMPQIDSFTPNGPDAAHPTSYTLIGKNLEMIQKVGWDPTNGIEVPNLPTPMRGEGQNQSLSVNLPAPPNNEGCLFLWLRGDTSGRATTIKNAPPPGGIPPVTTPAPPKTPPVL